MEWKLFGSTFAAIFLAEVGDKTQLATLSLAAGGSSRWAVFAGSALALVATSAIAVLAGEALSRAIPPVWVKRGAGALFIVLGIVFLLSRGDSEGGKPRGDAPGSTAQAEPLSGPTRTE
jgi:Ca2+/H+ antiporter, TMEM165/GDT1 family